jgi:predicted ATPase
MNLLTHLSIAGFRSIRDVSLQLRPLNILIGANGAGKSNLIDFFRLINYSLTRGFQDPYLVERGPASAILHFGAKLTPVVRAELRFQGAAGSNIYRFTLADSTGDRLSFTREEVQFQREGSTKPDPPIPTIPRPSDESGLAEAWADNSATVRFIKGLLARVKVYQFHDTSLTAHVRDYSPVDRGRFLLSDGGNLGAFLLNLKHEATDAYAAIVRTLRLLLPWFNDFLLEPEGPPQKQRVLMRWRMVGHGEYEFGPGQLSDGSLRLMALVSLLLQPVDRLPNLMLLDEPELGLHPMAEQVLAGLIQSASASTQVILATQSASLLNYFEPQDLIVVGNDAGASSFSRLPPDSLTAWLKRYSLGEIWNKNLIGGRP